MNVQEILKKGSLLMVIRAVGAFFTLLLSIYLARLLGAEDFGVITIALTMNLLVGSLMKIGQEHVIIKEASKHYRNKNYNSMMMQFVASLSIPLMSFIPIFSIAIVLIAILDINYYSSLITWLAVVMLLPFVLSGLLAEALRSTDSYVNAVLVQSVLLPFSVMILIFTFDVFDNVGLEEVLLSYLIGNLITLLYAVVIASNKYNAYFHDVLDNGLFKQIIDSIKLGKTFLISTIGSLVVFWTDIIVLTIFRGPYDVGLYSAASRYTFIISMVLVSINSIVVPRFSSYYSDGRIDELRSVVRKATVISIVVSLVPTIIIITFPVYMLSLFGSDFEKAKEVLLILTISQFINAACGPVAYLLNMTNNEKYVKKVIIYTSLLNIIMSIFLVNIYGIVGVAIATCFSIVVVNILMLMAVRKKLGFWMFSLK